ncbi:MAG: hypothetical protein JWP87_1192 [Labilithrix sp.]|nr:hypothetical protein [Labilithrix sp.]
MHVAPMRLSGGIATVVPLALVAFACTAPAKDPSSGSYTVSFPSTAAAVATDTVQLLVFDVPASTTERNDFCLTLIQGRKRQDPQKPLLANTPVNICEMLGGRKPITIPYGEKAVLAVAKRKSNDFLIGCVIQTFGDGDALLDIDLALVDVGVSVPDTTCATVGDFCGQKCPAI